MLFLELPQELILQIITHLHSIRDVYYLILVNRTLYNLLVPEIYKRQTLTERGEVLLQFAENGVESGIQDMLSLGPDVNYRPRNHYTRTALQTAIEAKNIGLVKFLLDNGAQPNLRVSNMRYKPRPLDEAIRQSPGDDLAMMTLLLDYGADANFRNHIGETPLFTAIEIGHLRKTALLLARGADVHIRGSASETPLHAATRQSRIGSMRLLLDKGSELNCVDHLGMSPLMVAALHRHKDAAQMLLNRGADVHFTNLHGRNALLEAAESGTKDIVQILLDWGADVHFIGPDGRNALHEATQNVELRATTIMKLLLECGLDINSRDNRQRTPLHYAISKSSYLFDDGMLEALLDFGAVVDARDDKGATALHYAAKQKLPDLIKWLSERMASVEACDSNGETPIFWALTTGDLGRTATSIQTLLDLGADGNHVNIYGQTPLCLAAHIWCSQSTAILLKQGGSVHHRDQDGMTPLHWFAASQEIPRNKNPLKILEMLIVQGANVNSQTLAGATPLSMIRKRYTMRHIRKFLMDAGATEFQDP